LLSNYKVATGLGAKNSVLPIAAGDKVFMTWHAIFRNNL